jgi:RsiW-degrading membrane proteinase PrsW (M82 family)
MLFQGGGESVFERWGNAIKDAWENADPVEVWAWVIIIIGIIALFLLIFFTEYKRKERDSIKFSVITLLIASICFSLGLTMLLNAYGVW